MNPTVPIPIRISPRPITTTIAFRNPGRLPSRRLPRNLIPSVPIAILYVLAAERKDQPAMEHELEVVRGKPEEEFLLGGQSSHRSRSRQIQAVRQHILRIRVARQTSRAAPNLPPARKRTRRSISRWSNDCAAARAAAQASLNTIPAGITAARWLQLCSVLWRRSKGLGFSSKDLLKEYPADTHPQPQTGPSRNRSLGATAQRKIR